MVVIVVVVRATGEGWAGDNQRQNERKRCGGFQSGIEGTHGDLFVKWLTESPMIFTVVGHLARELKRWRAVFEYLVNNIGKRGMPRARSTACQFRR